MKAKQTANNSNTFIESLANEIASFRNDYNYADFTVVFPTRRAALIFKLTFAKLLNHASLLPSVYSISDFIARFTPQRITEKKELLLEFYTIYKKHFKDIDFRTYAPWGEMILADFDEADRYLIDHKSLFADLKSFKEIETLFQNDEQQQEQLRKFYELFSLKDPTKLQQNFSRIWSRLPQFYESLFTQLQAADKTSEGHALNEMAKNPEKVLSGLNTAATVFAGFYALTPAEKKIFEYIQQGKGLIRWDADEYYVDSKDQEAGLFFRNNSLTKTEFKHKGNYFRTIIKNVNITGVPLVTGQIKYLGQQLQTLLSEGNINLDKTAIILPDETLLPQVLQSIPAEIEELNITMGYPFTNTTAFRFIHLLEELKRKSVVNSKQTLIHHQSFLQLLNHPYSKIFNSGMKKRAEEYGFYFPSEEMNEDAWKFISAWLKNEYAIDKHISVFNSILVYLKDVKSSEMDIAAFMLNELEELNALTKPYQTLLDNHACEMLVEELYNTTRIPFSGEPVKGLQIMGLLETRVLDFENIFIINVNEGSLPKTNKHHSFIPFTLRKSFNLPTYTEQDAISSYHFWRLLQRATHIELLYNTQADEFAGGERSRYLLQIFYEIKPNLKNWNITHQIVTPPLNKINYINPEIKRTPSLTKELKRLFNSGEVRISATALQAYINCSLQYYFKYIKKLKEPETAEEEMDGAMLGQILHHALEQLYKSAKTKPFTKKLAAVMKKEIENEVITAITEVYDKHYQRKGYAYIIEKILVRYIEQTIDADLTFPEFSVEETEADHEIKITLKENTSVIIKGKYDRVDKTKTGYRIVDYKTGKDELKRKKGVIDIFSQPKCKINFQLMFYLWLAERSGYKGEITAGIYPLRRISSGFEDIALKDWLASASEFDYKLIATLEEIIFETPFTQVEDASRCKYCPYKEICNR